MTASIRGKKYSSGYSFFTHKMMGIRAVILALAGLSQAMSLRLVRLPAGEPPPRHIEGFQGYSSYQVSPSRAPKQLLETRYVVRILT